MARRDTSELKNVRRRKVARTPPFQNVKRCRHIYAATHPQAGILNQPDDLPSPINTCACPAIVDPFGQPAEERDAIPGQQRQARAVRLENPPPVRHGHRDPTTGLEDPEDLGQGGLLVPDVLEDLEGDHGVDGLVGQGQAIAIVVQRFDAPPVHAPRLSRANSARNGRSTSTPTIWSKSAAKRSVWAPLPQPKSSSTPPSDGACPVTSRWRRSRMKSPASAGLPRERLGKRGVGHGCVESLSPDVGTGPY